MLPKHNLLIFFDLESFAHDWTCTALNYDGKEIGYWHNNADGMLDTFRNHVLVGFNNYNYDDYLLHYIIANGQPELINQTSQYIIKTPRSAIDYGLLPGNRGSLPFPTLDVSQQISPSRPGLKRIEGNMGMPVLESDVDFNIQRPLTDEELKQNHIYNRQDVKATVEVYKKREHAYFESKGGLTNLFERELRPYPNAYTWNTTTMTGSIILGKSHLIPWEGVRLAKDAFSKVADDRYDMIPEKVSDMWHNVQEDLVKYGKRQKGTKSQYKIQDYDNDVTFGLGGIHSQHTTRHVFHNVRFYDVTSMYPHILANLGILGIPSDRYIEIMNKRIGYKRSGNKPLSATLKIVINSVYGLLRSKYSQFYNPVAALSVNEVGQISLYDLSKRLSKFGTIAQDNTDGIAIEPKAGKDDQISQVIKEWQNDWQDVDLKLERTDYKVLYQKDVNNYVAIGEHLKVKGGDVGRYVDDPSHYWSNNSLRIVDVAIVDYLTKHKPIEQTVNDNLDKPILFQQVLQAGHTYDGTVDKDGKRYNKVNRVFAGKQGVHLMKHYADGRVVDFPNSPAKMWVYNDSLDNLKDLTNKIDINYYIDLINKILDRWKFEY